MLDILDTPRQFPQFGKHMSSLIRPRSEVFRGKNGSEGGKGSCGCGCENGSCGCGGGKGACGSDGNESSCGCGGASSYGCGNTHIKIQEPCWTVRPARFRPSSWHAHFPLHSRPTPFVEIDNSNSASSQVCSLSCLLHFAGCAMCLNQATRSLLSGGDITDYWNDLLECATGPCFKYETMCGWNPYCPPVFYPPVPDAPKPLIPDFPEPGSGRADLRRAKKRCEDDLWQCHREMVGMPPDQRVGICTANYYRCLRKAVACDYEPAESSSLDCDRYGRQTYLGASLRCFCKCAPDDDWSKDVRGCLRCLAEQGADTGDAHDICYELASLAHGARPGPTLAACLARCIYSWDFP